MFDWVGAGRLGGWEAGRLGGKEAWKHGSRDAKMPER